MKIAVVGKGGSGKSTISWLLTSYILENSKKNVLAIDADYNMDFSYLLAPNVTTKKVIDGIDDFFETVTGSKEHTAGHKLYTSLQDKSFSIKKGHKIKDLLYTKISEQLSMIVSGGYNETMVFGKSCSHTYYKPIKFYLTALYPKKDEIVIIDSVAGTDMVGYGLYIGVDAIVCVVEPTPQSINVLNQIQTISTMLDIPLFVVKNKAVEDQKFSIDDEYIDLGTITYDTGIHHRDTQLLESHNKKTLDLIINNIYDKTQIGTREIIDKRYLKYYELMQQN